MNRSGALDRRTVLRGAGVAVALPWLESLGGGGRARAAGSPALRFVGWYQPGGAVMSEWLPRGGERDFTLGPTLAPLEPFRDRLLVFEGLRYAVAERSTGHNHYRGLAAFLTGERLLPGRFNQAAGSPTGWAQGPSLDQVIARRIGGETRFPSLTLGVRYEGARGAHPTREMVYEAADRPVAPLVDPFVAWDRLFADAAAAAGDPAAAARALEVARRRERSVLDAVRAEYQGLVPRLGPADRRRLEQHLQSLRAVERALTSTFTPPGPGCQAPAAPPRGTRPTSESVPAMGKAMMDIMVMAFACNLTNVATLQWQDPLSRNAFPFLGLGPNHHHVFQHDGGYQPVPLAAIERWYSQQLGYLLRRLSEVRGAEDRSLLDDAAVLVGSELGHAGRHSMDGLPFLVAGNVGGRVRAGRFLRFPRASHQNLLVSLQNAFGVEGASFGYRETVTGPLPGLAT